MARSVITSDTVGGAAPTAPDDTLAKQTENLDALNDSEDIVTELPLEEWLLVLATTARRYEEAGGQVIYEQYQDKFVIHLQGVFYDEKERKLRVER